MTRKNHSRTPSASTAVNAAAHVHQSQGAGKIAGKAETVVANKNGGMNTDMKAVKENFAVKDQRTPMAPQSPKVKLSTALQPSQHPNTQKAAQKSKHLTKSSSKVNFNAAAGKQLILRPVCAIIVYRSLYSQISAWVAMQLRLSAKKDTKGIRGRSASKGNKTEKKNQMKSRAAAERRSGENITNARKSGGKQQANTAKANALNLNVDPNTNTWTNYLTPKQTDNASKSSDKPAAFKPSSTFVRQTSTRTMPVPSLIPTIPPPASPTSPEIFSFIGPQIQSRATSTPARKVNGVQGEQMTRSRSSSNSSPTGDTPDYFAVYMSAKPTPQPNVKSSGRGPIPIQSAMKSENNKNMNQGSLSKDMMHTNCEGSNSTVRVGGVKTQDTHLGVQSTRRVKSGGKSKKGGSDLGGDVDDGRMVRDNGGGNAYFNSNRVAYASAIAVLGGIVVGMNL